MPLIEYGHTDFGENKVQEAIDKWSKIKSRNINLHMIGKLQTNKVKFAVSLFDYIHSLDSIKLAKKISEEQNKIKKNIKIFIQVNIGSEIQKSGINIDELPQFYKTCTQDFNLNIIGLMCLPPVKIDPSNYFREIKNAADRLSLKNLRTNELNFWDANTNLIQKEFTTYTQKVELAERQSWHIIREYRKENARVRKTTKPKYFDEKFSIPNEVKDPKLVFPDLSYHYLTDQEREEKKIKFSEDIDQKFKKAEKEIEELQEASVNKQKDLHEKYNTH